MGEEEGHRAAHLLRSVVKRRVANCNARGAAHARLVAANEPDDAPQERGRGRCAAAAAAAAAVGRAQEHRVQRVRVAAHVTDHIANDRDN